MRSGAISLSVCYPVYDDFDGLYFSSMDLPLSHPEVADEIEIIVVDNQPDSIHGKTTASWVASHLAGAVRARYVAAPGPGGPALAKQRCVEEASGEFVLVMDSHVRVARGGIRRLIDYWRSNPANTALCSGPMFYDSSSLLAGKADTLSGFATHMEEAWRGQNLGTWATDPRGAMLDAEPFDIPAMGCGLFTARKDAFVGFNPHFRGFGGEEFYLHRKTLMAGKRVLCLPFLRWVHRFGRPAGAPYPLTRYAKVRNYVLGHQELGLPLDGIYEHFVTSGLMSQEEWDWVVADPIAHVEPMAAKKAGCGSCGKQSQPEVDLTLEQLYEAAAATGSDINQHVPKLRELASKCEVVVEFGLRAGVSTTALLAGQPKQLFSYDLLDLGVAPKLKQREEGTQFEFLKADVTQIDIPECDLLFEDSRHTSEHIVTILARHAAKVRRWIAFHDTAIFGERGEDGGPGILHGLRQFLRANPEWSVVYHTNDNHGFTVLSRDPNDKPKLPSMPKMAWNYAKALTKHAATGGKMADQATIEARLAVCDLCPQRTENRCSVCGCYLDEGPGGRDGKVVWQESVCPFGKW